MDQIVRLVHQFAYFLSRDKNDQSQEQSSLKILLTAVLTTGILMWSYTLNSYFTVGNVYGLKVMSFVYSLLHIFSPLLYLLIPSVVFVTYVFVGAGFSFQFHHSLATGGFYSNTIIWFSVLPLIVGVVIGLRHMLIWSFAAVIGVLVQFILSSKGEAFNEITPAGEIWAQTNIALGYLLINVALFVVYSDYRARSIATLQKKERRIHGLLRILVHDISSPLGLIRFGHAKLIKDSPRENQQQDLDRIKQGTEVISKIINTTRKFEALTSDSEKIKLVPTNLLQSTTEALQILNPRIKSKALEVKVNISKDINVMSDPSVLISQVLMNILSNAIKFSRENSVIEVRAELLADSSPGRVILEIIDQGIGIPEDILNNLFDEKKVVSRAGTNGELGTGFGMPIVAMMMEKFNGCVKVKTKTEGETGTCFTLEFDQALT